MNSLRQKITLGYYTIGGLIVGLSVLAFVELHMIEGKVLAGERISEFFDATLEFRRFEKNYFLYRKMDDASENRDYVIRAQHLLKSNFADFALLAGEPQVVSLGEALTEYGRLMTAYVQQPARVSGGQSELENRIRKAGKDIVTVAEEMARAERKHLQTSLERHRLALIVSIVTLMVLVVAIGQLLSRMVSRPLKQVEESMEAVANGGRDQIDIPFSDREIVSLINAFNHVLQELELRQSHLVRSEKLASLGTLLSGVAHELNNPLSNISTSCQILIEELEVASPEFIRELLEQIDDQTGRARNIVRSLLDFARDREFKREPLQLAGVVAETLRFVKGQMTSRIAIVSEISPDIFIEGDKQRLQQVFINLIKNAIEALDGSGEITIRAVVHSAGMVGEASGHFRFLSRCNQAGESVEIEVSDNGHGVQPEVLSRIFDPFFTTKDVGKGSGLGLFIVYEIIEEHDGCISAESEPGKGTSFYIRLPINHH